MSVRFIPLNMLEHWHTIVKPRVPVRICEDTKGIIALDGDEVVAVAIFDSWTVTTVQCHQWIKNAMVLRHGWLEEIYYYVFDFCGRDKIMGLVPGDNEKALQFNHHIGFNEVYRIEEGFDVGVDYVLMEGTKEALHRWKPKEEAA